MKDWVLTSLGIVCGALLAGFIHLLTAPRIVWRAEPPGAKPRVYFANHTSNADTVLIWAALPARLRRRTRPVAAADYWLKSAVRKFAGTKIFDTVLIQRNPDLRGEANPVAQMSSALDAGASLILFPEGRRNESDAPLLPFKTGLYHLASERPDIDLVPVWIDNLNAVMPRGEVIPVPLICQMFFGEPIRIAADESRDLFLARAQQAMLSLRPNREEARV